MDFIMETNGGQMFFGIALSELFLIKIFVLILPKNK